MINQINSNALTGATYQANAGQTAASKEKSKAAADDGAAYILDIGNEGNEAKGKGLGADEIKAIKEQADASTSGLRDLVEKLIMKQQSNSPMFSVSIQILGDTGAVMSQSDAQAAIGDNGEWGVGAVSDRIVDFAKSISGGDPAKIQELKDAIDKGFARAKKMLGGSMPDISSKTYDAVMSKMDDWASGKDTAKSE